MQVLVRGHIFLNCSLTESFCIALLEAASCGLFVVTTKVGGVPEVLPPGMIKFAEPNVRDLVVALSEAISASRSVTPKALHQRIVVMYSWMDVSERIERIYDEMAIGTFPSLASRFLRCVSLLL
jgi:phosphatidylinositol N-acetylglucosaminyltransferase subunit A